MRHTHLPLNEEQKHIEKELFTYIKPIIATHFPKNCRNCNTDYLDEEEYLNRTSRCKNAQHEHRSSTLAFYRNCSCDSTLMIPINYLKQFDAAHIYFFRSHIEELASLVKTDIIKLISKKEPLNKSFSWIYLKEFPTFKKNDEYGALSNLKKNDWFETGLCIFRDKYNSWRRKD